MVGAVMAPAAVAGTTVVAVVRQISACTCTARNGLR